MYLGHVYTNVLKKCKGFFFYIGFYIMFWLLMRCQTGLMVLQRGPVPSLAPACKGSRLSPWSTTQPDHFGSSSGKVDEGCITSFLLKCAQENNTGGYIWRILSFHESTQRWKFIFIARRQYTVVFCMSSLCRQTGSLISDLSHPLFLWRFNLKVTPVTAWTWRRPQTVV